MDDMKQYFREELQRLTVEWLMGEKSTASAVRSLGLEKANRQMVWAWKKGKQSPHEMTAWKVVLSPNATQAAKVWANKVLDAYSRREAREYSLTEEVLNNLR